MTLKLKDCSALLGTLDFKSVVQAIPTCLTGLKDVGKKEKEKMF